MSEEEQRGWMYSGWSEHRRHTAEWVCNTDAFLDRAFQLMPNASDLGVKCPCEKCCNKIMQKQPVIRSHLFKHGFMLDYARWTEHGEPPAVSSTRTEELLAIVCDIAPEGHKVPATVQECKNLLSGLETPSMKTDKTEGESSKRKRGRILRK